MKLHAFMGSGRRTTLLRKAFFCLLMHVEMHFCCNVQVPKNIAMKAHYIAHVNFAIYREAAEFAET
jgi:hypothetical protein